MFSSQSWEHSMPAWFFYCRQRLTEAVRQKSRYNQLSLYQIRKIEISFPVNTELRFPGSTTWHDYVLTERKLDNQSKWWATWELGDEGKSMNCFTLQHGIDVKVYCASGAMQKNDESVARGILKWEGQCVGNLPTSWPVCVSQTRTREPVSDQHANSLPSGEYSEWNWAVSWFHK